MTYSFSSHQKRVEVQGFLRRMTDVTTPNRPPLGGDHRSENRHNRTLPVVLTPWQEGMPNVEESVLGVTKDLSDRGMAIIVSQPLQVEEGGQLVVGFWVEAEPRLGLEYGPRFALGEVKRNERVAIGFWEVGVEVHELLTTADLPEFKPLVQMATSLVSD